MLLLTNLVHSEWQIFGDSLKLVIDTLAVTVISASLVSLYFERLFIDLARYEMSRDLRSELHDAIRNVFNTDNNTTYRPYKWSCVLYKTPKDNFFRQLVELQFSPKEMPDQPFIICAATSPGVPDELIELRRESKDCILIWTIPKDPGFKDERAFVLNRALIHGEEYLVFKNEDLSLGFPAKKILLKRKKNSRPFVHVNHFVVLGFECLHFGQSGENTFIRPTIYQEASEAHFHLTLADIKESYSVSIKESISPVLSVSEPLLISQNTPESNTKSLSVVAHYPVKANGLVIFALSKD